MVTAIYNDDIEYFRSLAPSSEWEYLGKKKYRAIGCISETADGTIASGVLIYKIEINYNEPKKSFIHVRWIYASLLYKDAKPIYEELLSELFSVAKRMDISTVTIEIFPKEDYNYEELWPLLRDKGFVLVSERDSNIIAATKLIFKEGEL